MEHVYSGTGSCERVSRNHGPEDVMHTGPGRCMFSTNIEDNNVTLGMKYVKSGDVSMHGHGHVSIHGHDHGYGHFSHASCD